MLPARGAGGRGAPNGLFPGRGAGVVGRGALESTGADGAVGGGVTGRASAAAFCAVACCANSGEISANSSTAASGVSVSFAGFAADFLAAAFFTGFFSSTGFASGYWAMSFATTGASTVDDADRTNSPISWSFASTTLLSIPSCFANSCTRTFDTVLLSWPALSNLMIGLRCEP
ncbi:unannotated protein [freshwater metagenome]|uniref:Unannotated protein n=1 Tax=freshwater metagenome TaxID=449393 RepID=A0A6J7PVG0_9ZZZZ